MFYEPRGLRTAVIVIGVTLPLSGSNDTFDCFDAKVNTFLLSDARQFEFDLEECRPDVKQEIHAAGLRAFNEALPERGEVLNLSQSERRKIVALDRVLAGHIPQSAYVRKVLTLPQAAVGLYERSVLWMSQSVIELLNEQELQAVIAHEVGHGYVWRATRDAQDAKDHVRLRQIELFCDAVAILTLRRLGLNPRSLLTSVEKMERFNNERFGSPLNSASYPMLSERKKWWTRVMNWIGSPPLP